MERIEKPLMVKIKKIKQLNKNIKYFELDFKRSAYSGQFCMFWLPGLDEKPFSVYSNDCSKFVIKKFGKGTEYLFNLKEGDKIGIRGPYGRAFSMKENEPKRAVIIAGGIGVPPLIPLAKKLAENGIEVDFIYGASNSEELVLKKEVEKFAKNVFYCTDDGSLGRHGFTTDELIEQLKSKKYGIIYGCGPEIMLKKVFEIAEQNKIDVELSLERYMKCGFGVCGQCVIDEFMVCKDGPVFDSIQLRKMTEFGSKSYTPSGKRVLLNKMHNIKEVGLNE